MKDAVVFFLAHNGISQFQLWKDWKALSETTNIHFRVLTKPEYAQTEQTELVRKQNNQPVYIGQTKWARFSIVYETLVGYFYIAQESLRKGWTDDTIVFLVSGTDIPIRHPHQMFDLITNDLVCYTKPSQEHDVYFHSQFISLTLGTIKHVLLRKIGLVLSRPLDKKKIHDWWEPVMRQMTRYRDINTIVPDMIFLNGIFTKSDEIGDKHCTTISFASSDKLNSPITWDQEEKIVYFTELVSKKFYIKVDLEQILYICQFLKRRRPFLFFFRKVSSTITIPSSFMMENIWVDRPPDVSFNQLLSTNVYYPTQEQEKSLHQAQTRQRQQLTKAARQQLQDLKNL